MWKEKKKKNAFDKTKGKSKVKNIQKKNNEKNNGSKRVEKEKDFLKTNDLPK